MNQANATPLDMESTTKLLEEIVEGGENLLEKHGNIQGKVVESMVEDNHMHVKVAGNYKDMVQAIEDVLRAKLKHKKCVKVFGMGHGGRDVLGSMVVVEAANKLRSEDPSYNVEVKVLSSTWPEDTWVQSMQNLAQTPWSDKNANIKKELRHFKFVKFDWHQGNLEIMHQICQHAFDFEPDLVMHFEQGYDLYTALSYRKNPLPAGDPIEDKLSELALAMIGAKLGCEVLVLDTNPFLDLDNGVGKKKAITELKPKNNVLQQIPENILDFAKRLQKLVRSGHMKGKGAEAIVSAIQALHEKQSKSDELQKESALPKLSQAIKDKPARFNEQGNLLARVLLILINEGHDVPIAGIMEVLTQMLEFEAQHVPNWYLGVLYNKEHLQELQWVFKNVWRRCKQDKTFDETFISSATWIFYWMEQRAIGEISHQVDIYQEILDKIGIHWCAKLK